MKRMLPIVALFSSLITSPLPCRHTIASSQTTPVTPSATASMADTGHGLLASTPAPVLAGAALANVTGIGGGPKDSVFAFRGGETRDFWEYSISQDQWTALPDAPAPVGDGAGLVAVHTYTFCSHSTGNFCIAAIRGGGTSDFWMFDISANRWCSAPDTPAPVGAGGAIAQLQAIGEIYVLRGGGTKDFWRFYSTDGWSRRADAPGPVNAGGALVGINYGSPGFMLYALQGGGSSAVWKYDVDADLWTHQSDAPAAVGPGGALTSPAFGDLGTLDVLLGGGSSAIWSLEVAENAWTRIADAPGQISAGGANSYQYGGCDFALVGGGSRTFFSSGIRDCRGTVTPDFSLNFDQPTVVTSPGTKIRVRLNIVRTGGFTGSVTLAPPSTLPSGIKIPGEFAATTEDQFTFKIKVKGSLQPGLYPLVFVGVGGATQVHTAALTLVVQ